MYAQTTSSQLQPHNIIHTVPHTHHTVHVHRNADPSPAHPTWMIDRSGWRQAWSVDGEVRCLPDDMDGWTAGMSLDRTEWDYQGAASFHPTKSEHIAASRLCIQNRARPS